MRIILYEPMRAISKKVKLGVAVAAMLVVGGIAVAVRLQPGREPGGAATAQNGSSAFRTDGASPSQNGDSSGYQTHWNPEPKFSFRYPAGFTVSPIEDESGGTLLVRNLNGQKQEFQIHISEFDEPTPFAKGEGAGGGESGLITPERIRQDIPDMVIEDPQYVILSASEGSRPFDGARGRDSSPLDKLGAQNDGNEGGVRALAFFSQDASLGKTREVWFVSGGFLYQITAYPELDEVLSGVLKTWKFQ